MVAHFTSASRLVKFPFHRLELPELIAHHFSNIRRTVFNHCTEEILSVDYNKRGSSIGHVLLRQQMAKVIVLFILKGFSHQSDVSAAESIVKLLGDDDYEVRSITLETLNELMFSRTNLRYDLMCLSRRASFHSVNCGHAILVRKYTPNDLPWALTLYVVFFTFLHFLNNTYGTNCR